MEIQTENKNQEAWGLDFSHDEKQILGGNYSGGREAGTVPHAPMGEASEDGRRVVHAE